MTQTSGAALEARLDTRYPASAVPSIVGVRLSPGDAVELVNISKSGVLVEGRTRFVSGTRVTVIFTGGFTPSSIEAKVIRCQVSSIVGGALHYHSGIQFTKRLDVLDTETVCTAAARAGTRLRDAGAGARTAGRPGKNRILAVAAHHHAASSCESLVTGLAGGQARRASLRSPQRARIRPTATQHDLCHIHVQGLEYRWIRSTASPLVVPDW